jgi:hypothetical protein
MQPYERSELGGVGEGVWAIDRAQPLTQLRLIAIGDKSAQPSPIGRGNSPCQNPRQPLMHFLRKGINHRHPAPGEAILHIL